MVVIAGQKYHGELTRGYSQCLKCRRHRLSEGRSPKTNLQQRHSSWYRLIEKSRNTCYSCEVRKQKTIALDCLKATDGLTRPSTQSSCAQLQPATNILMWFATPFDRQASKQHFAVLCCIFLLTFSKSQKNAINHKTRGRFEFRLHLTPDTNSRYLRRLQNKLAKTD